MTPNPGDIGLVTVTGQVGRLIRVGQWANGDGYRDYEHAFVYVGGWQLVEAEPAGARLVSYDEYSTRALLWLRCPRQLGDAVAEAARTLVGTPYSALDYFALAAHRFHLPAPFLRARIESTGELICSQLADLAAARGGWHLFDDGRWPGYVTPGALADLATKGP